MAFVNEKSIKVNLATAMCSKKYKNCYGFVYRFSNGKYASQNDNDLGLDSEEIDAKVSAKKVKCGKGYILLVRNERGCVPKDDGTGTSLKLALALLKECHEFIDPLTPKETKMVKKYWSKFCN